MQHTVATRQPSYIPAAPRFHGRHGLQVASPQPALDLQGNNVSAAGLANTAPKLTSSCPVTACGRALLKKCISLKRVMPIQGCWASMLNSAVVPAF